MNTIFTTLKNKIFSTMFVSHRNSEITNFKQLLDKTDFTDLSPDKLMDRLPDETTLIPAKNISKDIKNQFLWIFG